MVSRTAFQVKSEGESIVSNFERIDLPHPRDISRMARLAILEQRRFRDHRGRDPVRSRALDIFHSIFMDFSKMMMPVFSFNT